MREGLHEKTIQPAGTHAGTRTVGLVCPSVRQSVRKSGAVRNIKAEAKRTQMLRFSGSYCGASQEKDH